MGVVPRVAIAVKRKEQLRILMLMDTLEKHFPRLVKVCYVVSELSFAAFCMLVFTTASTCFET